MKLYLSLLTVFFSIIAFSQEFEIKGKIVDESNKAIDFAEIYLLSRDSVVLKKEFTDENGDFNILAEKGKYVFQVKQLGDLLYNKNIEVFQDIDLGTIQIKIISKEIETILVEGKEKLIERKVDRLVFNVENSISASGGDALDALKITPGVNVQNEKISLVGKNGVSVMIDDRIIQLTGEDLFTYLKGIRSEDIKSIEVITTPPAKYEAEGNSGIINIKLKTVKKDSWSSSLSSTYQQGKYASFNENIGFNFKKDKLSVSTNIGHSDGVNFIKAENEYIYFIDKYIESRSKLKSNVKENFYGNLGLDYQFTNKISSGFQIRYNKFNQSIDENNDQKVFDVSNLLTQTFAEGISKKNNFSMNFHSQYKLDSLGSNIVLNVDYFDYKTIRDRTFVSKDYLNFTDYISENDYSAQNTSNQNISNISAKIDVEHKLKQYKIGYGAKVSHSKNTSNLEYYDLTSSTPILETDKSNTFEYKEDLQALYLSVSGKLAEKWETQLGLRLESTESRGYSVTLDETRTYNYTKLFPTIYILYKIDDNNNLNFNYSKRINRPSFQTLNPFVRYINQKETSEGNPELLPSFSDNLELNYSYRSNWNTSIFFTKNRDVIQQVNYLNSNGIYTATKYENCCNEYSYGISQSYIFNKIKWLESSTSIMVFYKDNKSKIPEFKSGKGWSASLETDNTITLNSKKTLFLLLDSWYLFPQYSSLYRMKAIYETNIGFKALFFNKQLIFTAYVEDIFKNHRVQLTSTTYNNSQSTFKNNEYRQSIRFSIKYNFGNQKIRSKEIKSSNDEEKRRAN